MSKKVRKQGGEDMNELAFRVVQELTGQASPDCEEDEPPKARAGRKGGLKGGKARAEKLTPERRSEIARQAALKRWGKD